MKTSLLLPPQWSDLPLDLLQLISSQLGDDSTSTVDLLRLRSVCATWHMFLPVYDKKNNNPSSKFPKHLPFWSSSSSGYFTIKQSNVYKLKDPSRNWLVKLEETSPGKMRVLDLFSNEKLSFLPESFPENIDLQESHVRLIRRAYRLEYATNNDGSEISRFWSLSSDKVVIFTSAEDSALMAIHSGGKLGFLRSGNDEEWRVLDNSWDVTYEDIMLYGDNCIVVDDKGKTVIYDVDFNVSELAGGLAGGGGHKKHLVEYSRGKVLLVDKYVRHVWCKTEFSKSTVEFRVYKLNREEKRWEEAIEIGDLALLIGEDLSFSVVRDLARNCIFYRDYRNGGRLRGVCCNGNGVFNVEYEIQGDYVFSC